MFAGKYRCQIPGIYFFNVNIHTWNFKETYLHIMQNNSEKAIVYAQPSERSIMQSQSIMLPLQEGDEVWVRLYKRERENAIYSDDVDIYITFNGYLIKPETEWDRKKQWEGAKGMFIDMKFENMPKCLISGAALTKMKSNQTFHIRYLQSKQKS